MTEDRKTFTVPDGYEAVLDAAGRATGEVRPLGSSGQSVGVLLDRFERAAMAYERLGKITRDDEKTRAIRKDAITELSAARGAIRSALTVQSVGEPVAWRWQAKCGGDCWVYNPDPQWLKEQYGKITVEPLYASSVPALAEGMVETLNATRAFLGKVQGVTLGVAMSGKRHPNPDGVLMELSQEAQKADADLRALDAALTGTPAPAGDVEQRHTFTVPDGYEAVRDIDGRATGEIRPAATNWKNPAPDASPVRSAQSTTTLSIGAVEGELVGRAREAMRLLDRGASVLSNMGRPRFDNNDGRAAQVIEDLLSALSPGETKPTHEPGTIRICPMRDGPCPHGMSCPFVGDGHYGYPCKEGWNTAAEGRQP